MKSSVSTLACVPMIFRYFNQYLIIYWVKNRISHIFPSPGGVPFLTVILTIKPARLLSPRKSLHIFETNIWVKWFNHIHYKKNCSTVIRKLNGGQRPVRIFLKNHPIWCSHPSLTEQQVKRQTSYFMKEWCWWTIQYSRALHFARFVWVTPLDHILRPKYCQGPGGNRKSVFVGVPIEY